MLPELRRAWRAQDHPGPRKRAGAEFFPVRGQVAHLQVLLLRCQVVTLLVCKAGRPLSPFVALVHVATARAFSKG